MSGLFWITLLYISAHFAVYGLVLRYRSAFRSERAIFLYHAVSFLNISIGCLTLLTFNETTAGTPSLAVAAVSMHGIYSLSFLELWSLCQGSFSLGILSLLYENKRLSRADADRLESTGDNKFCARLESLLRLGLISKDEEELWKCTTRGLIVSRCLAAVSQVSGAKRLETLSNEATR